MSSSSSSPFCFLVIFVLDIECIVSDDSKLVGKHMTDDSVLLQHHSEYIVAECASGLDIEQISVPDCGFYWDRISELMNHVSTFR
jgi:hypothetical protein